VLAWGDGALGCSVASDNSKRFTVIFGCNLGVHFESVTREANVIIGFSLGHADFGF
jgi:hypothetical protein